MCATQRSGSGCSRRLWLELEGVCRLAAQARAGTGGCAAVGGSSSDLGQMLRLQSEVVAGTGGCALPSAQAPVAVGGCVAVGAVPPIAVSSSGCSRRKSLESESVRRVGQMPGMLGFHPSRTDRLHVSAASPAPVSSEVSIAAP